jgi:hypothetical protein
MKTSETLNPDGNGLHPFLHAVIGRDSQGADVTMLFALARQGLDPWSEGAELSCMGHEAAVKRIDSRLRLVNDVEALTRDRAAVTDRMAGLLPKARITPVASAVQGAVARTPLRNPGLIIAIIILVAFIIPLFFGVAVDTSP